MVSHEQPAPRRGRWQLLVSLAMSAILLGIAYHARHEIIAAFGLLETARPAWIIAAFAVILASYFVSSLVFRVALASLGYRADSLRLWAVTIVAIIVSQSVPAGGVASYAFLNDHFKRRGVSPGQSALIASLETLSYACAMLLFFVFSLIYLAFAGQAAGRSTYGEGAIALVIIGLVLFALTRSRDTLHAWARALAGVVIRISRRRVGARRIRRTIEELVRGRDLLLARRRTVTSLIVVQLLALTGHSLAMLLILSSLGVEVNLLVTMAAFGIALVTSTFNVLPGGGGTVEAALIAILVGFAVGPAAVPAAVLFRLLNFWLIAPVALGGYYWLTHGK